MSSKSSCPPSSKRRQIDRKKRDDNKCKGNCLLLEKPEILMALVKSRYLTDKETGRFFLCTAKAITNQGVSNDVILLDGTTDDDWVWKQLCERKWGKNSTANKLRHTGWTAEKFYRKFSGIKNTNGKSEDNQKSLPPPKYSPKDYTLIVELKISKSLMDICKTIPGHRIEELFQKGSAKVEYDNPIWKGKVPHWKEEGMVLEPQVSILRRPDDKLVKIGSEWTSVGLLFQDDASDVGKEIEAEVYDWDGCADVEGSLVPGRLADLELPYDFTEVRIDAVPIYKRLTAKTFGIFGFRLCGMFIYSSDWDYDETHAEWSLKKHEDENIQFAHYLEMVHRMSPFCK